MRTVRVQLGDTNERMCLVDVGQAILVMAWIFCGRGLLPAGVKRKPRYSVVCTAQSHFNGLTIKPFLSNLRRTWQIWERCSEKEPSEKIPISSMNHSILGRSENNGCITD